MAIQFSKFQPVDLGPTGLETPRPWPLRRCLSRPPPPHGPAGLFRLPSAYEAARVSSDQFLHTANPSELSQEELRAFHRMLKRVMKGDDSNSEQKPVPVLDVTNQG